ncbi:unnamed protein product [Somion occarium]|uniref:Uncharacterized protein n=1 Tax=Somion occarium TaxID=3059160 RepID=A0ABP1DTA5_9APHY
MPTPGRFRSKTSDISDLLRGSASRHSESQSTPPVSPPVQTPEATTPTKGKRKPLALFSRRRKSSVSPSPSSVSAKSTDHAFSSAEEVPPVPDVPSRHAGSQDASFAQGDSHTLQTSLPPLNVSPPSFGFSHFAPARARASDVTQTPDPGKLSTAIPPQALRAQKSTSFEFIARNRFGEKTSSRSSRPVITVSAPPQNGQHVENDKDVFTTPRAAPNPPAAPNLPAAPAQPEVKSRRTLRKPLVLSFSHKKTHPEKVTSPTSPKLPVPSSPTINRTPPLPAQMRFPIPPGPGGQLPRPSQDSLQSMQRRRGNAGMSDESPVPSPVRGSFSSASGSVRTYVPGDRTPKEQGGKLSPAGKFLPTPGDVSPTRTRFSSSSGSPSGTIGRAAGATLGKSAKPPHLRLSMRRTSRTPSPASTPPTAPLPDLPSEASAPPSPIREGHSPTVLSPGPYSPASRSPTLNGLPTTQSMSSVASRRSFTSIPHRSASVIRSRASSASAQATPTPVAARNEVTNKGKSKDQDDRTDTSEGTGYAPAPNNQHGRKPSKDSERLRRQESTDTPRLRKIDTSVVQQHLLPDYSSLRARHETLIRSLQEVHAAEKAELLRRIEQLEREARKREREIKGLRWLVMNAGNSTGDPTSQLFSLAEGRRRDRAGSKASDASQDSSTGSHTEEGLYEVQASISDLISPTEGTPPTISSGEKQQNGKTRARRSNTLPFGSQTSLDPKSLVAIKQARRTSSPVIPANGSPVPAPSSTSAYNSSNSLAGTGLGIQVDYPSIPSLAESGYTKSSSGSSAMTMPSMTLTATNTTSSSLSAIPESPRRIPPDATDSMIIDMERREKEERRASRALKRISASSTSSSLGLMAVTAYNHNLKIGQSPSIDQVLDSPEMDIDDVMRKLRAFGGHGA